MVNYCTFFSLLKGDYGYLIFSVAIWEGLSLRLAVCKENGEDAKDIHELRKKPLHFIIRKK